MSPGQAPAPEAQEAGVADRPIRAILKAIAASPGVWLGIGGYALALFATFLPWYFVAVRAEGTQFDPLTTVLQFDGLNGLFVHPELKPVLGVSAPSVGFPIGLLFLITIPFKVRKLLRSSAKKMRAVTLLRSSIYTVVPAIATIALIVLLPSFIPADAPLIAHEMAGDIASQPLGGGSPIVFQRDLPVRVAVPAEMHWGFGPALFLMLVAAVLMNLGSRLERRSQSRAHQQGLLDQAEA